MPLRAAPVAATCYLNRYAPVSPLSEAVVPFPPPRTALAKWQAASAARMGIPEAWSCVSKGKQPLNSYSKAIRARLCAWGGSRTSRQGFGRGRTGVLGTLSVLNVRSIINLRANECPGGAMGDFSAAVGNDSQQTGSQCCAAAQVLSLGKLLSGISKSIGL